jgi:hypothetical protein
MNSSRCARALVLVAVLATLGAAAPAAADDQSVYAAWTSEDAEAERLQRAIGREADRWGRTGRAGRLLRLIGEVRALVDRVTAAVTAEQPSSEAGARAKEFALSNLDNFDREFLLNRRAIKAAEDGRFRRARRLLNRAERREDAANRAHRRARRAFREAGIDTS